MKRVRLGWALAIGAVMAVSGQDDLDWNATPNDVNNLLKSMKEMIDVNYSVQVATLEEVSVDPAKNPILYRSGHYNFSYTDEQRKRMIGHAGVGVYASAVAGAAGIAGR